MRFYNENVEKECAIYIHGEFLESLYSYYGNNIEINQKKKKIGAPYINRLGRLQYCIERWKCVYKHVCSRSRSAHRCGRDRGLIHTGLEPGGRGTNAEALFVKLSN